MTSSSSSSDDSAIPAVASEIEVEVAGLRAANAKLKERERRLMELLKATAPERIEHDLRNVLNELVLLRTLVDLKPSDS